MSSSRPTLIPARSVSSWKPSSICAPAQAWHVPSVGSCWPSEITQGQNTVQLHESTKSPLIFQLSLSATSHSPARLCVFHRPMRDDRCDDKGDPNQDEERAERAAKARGGADLLDRHDCPERRHPDHVHHADREHREHHRPAAAETIEPLAESEPEHAAWI